MISYDVSIGLIIIAVVLCVGSLSLSEIVIAQENIPFIFPLFPAAIIVVYSCMLCNLCMVLLRMCALLLVSVSDSHVGMTIIDLSESIASEPR